MKCKQVRDSSSFTLVSENPIIYKPVCAYCNNRIVDKAAQREKRLAGYRAYTKARYQEIKKKDPGFARRAWAVWEEQHPEYQAVRHPQSLDSFGFVYELEANKEAVDPHREAVAGELNDWLEEHLTEQELSAVLAFAETLDEKKAAKALGLWTEDFHFLLLSAREKAKEFYN